jgi:hypothetical protein
MNIKVSIGEVIDKLTILEIKKAKLQDLQKLANVENEYNYLLDKLNETKITDHTSFKTYYNDLMEVNLQLWDIEDGKRSCEREKDFGEHFVQLARQVYIKNDLRASIKKAINIYYNSDIVEEKSYSNYV